MNKTFNECWLEQLIESSNNLKEFCVIENVVKNPEFVTANIRESIANITNYKDKAIMRVFIENGQNFRQLENLRNNPIKNKESIHEWITQSIGTDKYTVTFNGITKWSHNFHKLTTEEVIQPIARRLGEPISGVDSYAFIATHGDTPFGVHEDLDDSLIFHLGPNNKEVWIWKHERYLDLMKSDERIFEFSDIENEATKFSLKPGDCLFIPKGDFHVFHNNSFSIFLGFILFPNSNEKMIKKSLEELIEKEEIPSFSSDFSINDLNFSFNDSNISKGYNEYINCLKSNGYLIHKALPINFEQINNDYLVNKVFDIPIVDVDNFTYVYIKGHRLEFEKSDNVRKILSKILEKEKVNIHQLYNEISGKNYFDDYVFKALIKSLLEYCILEGISNEDL
ncbi:cupin domain-containing protein [Macrococcus caseolyticus]|uniref:cupin domain-containing protein n=1 Tax=Macrococcoides caseolyticum TaxID=69966 RepID=UPI0024BD003D|nr:cupin domain-containing protein [Macrococcus caseolyticus]MDJ1110518.1 cupin domain-containing protein [Macrococcus caseolyticus]